MTISIRLFASLSEELGFSETTLEIDHVQTIADLWKHISQQPMPENLLCARNHQYVGLSDVVVDGDEVAFFPPVNGG